MVVERFYNYISEAKLKGGGAPVREAYKLISAERSRLAPGLQRRVSPIHDERLAGDPLGFVAG